MRWLSWTRVIRSCSIVGLSTHALTHVFAHCRYFNPFGLGSMLEDEGTMNSSTRTDAN